MLTNKEKFQLNLLGFSYSRPTHPDFIVYLGQRLRISFFMGNGRRLKYIVANELPHNGFTTYGNYGAHIWKGEKSIKRIIKLMDREAKLNAI